MEKDAIRVVIADDEPISRMDLKELLTEGGYTVVAEVSDGFDAVENCKLYHPDLVLLDIKMPFLDGLAAAKIIYEEELADTIIMLTAYSEREFVEQAKDYGVSGYLVKAHRREVADSQHRAGCGPEQGDETAAQGHGQGFRAAGQPQHH